MSKLLREDIEHYTKLTGVDGCNVPILKVGAYLDGYNKGLEVLDKIRKEIETEKNAGGHTWYIGGLDFALSIIDKYMVESED